MKWPWVSRRAYDVLESERDRLREQNDALFDHFKRMDRVEHKLGEAVRPPRPEPEPMPILVRNYIKGFANPQIQKTVEEQCKRRYRNGESWAKILKEIQQSEEVGDAPAGD